MLLGGEDIKLVVGKRILSTFPACLEEGVLAFLETFYLLTLDYPVTHEVGPTMLQQLFFLDLNVPEDITSSLLTTRRRNMLITMECNFIY